MLTVLVIVVVIFVVMKGLSQPTPPPPPPNEQTRWYRVPTFQRQKRPKDRYITVRVDKGEEPPFGGELVATGAERKIVRKDIAHAHAVLTHMKGKTPQERKRVANSLLWGSHLDERSGSSDTRGGTALNR